jgi:ribosomal 50S subunit-recycling heat shock protein
VTAADHGMRIDLVLKYLCLVKSRSIAKSLCDDQRVFLNGAAVRSSATVRAGDRVTVHFARRSVSVEVETVPEKQLSKSNALTYYRSVETPVSERQEDPLADI